MLQKKSFRFAESAVILLLCVLMLAGLGCVLTPKWSDDYKSGAVLRGFYQMPRNRVDVLILGSSHVICGVDANALYSDFGLSAYSCGTEAQPVLASYYWLREALRRQDIKAVIFDVADVFADSDEASYRKSFDYMRFSPLKLEALLAYRRAEPEMELGSYLFPLIAYHDRWSQLTAEDWDGADTPALRGFYPRAERRGTAFAGLNPQRIAAAEAEAIPETNLAYFRRLIELCRDRDIELLLTETPSIDFTAGEHRAVADIAEEYGLRFLDFNVVSAWPDIDYAADMADFKHFNLYGAQKAGAHLAEALLAARDLPDRRGDAFLDGLDAVYRFERGAAVLRGASDARSYLSALADGRYAVLLASKPARFSALDRPLDGALQALGLAAGLNDGQLLAYAAAAEGGAAPAERRAETAAAVHGVLSDGTEYRVAADADGISVLLDGTEYACAGPGLSIVVYDLAYGAVADSVNLNLNTDALTLSREDSGDHAENAYDDCDNYDGGYDGARSDGGSPDGRGDSEGR